ncbi:MAG: hypothetical protein H7336_13060 [Bacteriovorax sp.]|nr:hypothetical protein [Bacteriovorax sp.]
MGLLVLTISANVHADAEAQVKSDYSFEYNEIVIKTLTLDEVKKLENRQVDIIKKNGELKLSISIMSAKWQLQ